MELILVSIFLLAAVCLMVFELTFGIFIFSPLAVMAAMAIWYFIDPEIVSVMFELLFITILGEIFG